MSAHVPQRESVDPANRTRPVGVPAVMHFAMGLLVWLVVVPGAAGATSLVQTPAEAYGQLERSHTPFDPSVESFSETQERFLSGLFALVDEGVLLNANVASWFVSGGREGLHFEDYRPRVDALRAQLDSLETPEAAVPARNLIAAALRLQRDFLAEWHAAREEGRVFESQIGSEFGYHAGLHLSHRKLVQAMAELRALFPAISEQTQRAILDHLRGLDLT